VCGRSSQAGTNLDARHAGWRFMLADEFPEMGCRNPQFS